MTSAWLATIADFDGALAWTARLIALAVALQTLELIMLREQLSDTGIFAFSVLRVEHQALPTPLRALLGILLPYRPFLAILSCTFACALVQLATGTLQFAPVLFGGTLLSAVRFRGAFNGGSDSMTLLILLSLSIAAFAPHIPQLGNVCIGLIAVHSTLSYLIAGLTKLKEPTWRSGTALQLVLHGPQYAVPRRLAMLCEGTRGVLFAWCVMVFECAFVLVWFDARVCVALLGLGALFHLANAYVLGLNRFFFAWLASYPAIYYFGEIARHTANNQL